MTIVVGPISYTLLSQRLLGTVPRWHCIALHCIALHCIALHCIALHCIALHCIALHCIALHCIALHCIALHCIALHCIALHCIVLYCIVCCTLGPRHLTLDKRNVASMMLVSRYNRCSETRLNAQKVNLYNLPARLFFIHFDFQHCHVQFSRARSDARQMSPPIDRPIEVLRREVASWPRHCPSLDFGACQAELS